MTEPAPRLDPSSGGPTGDPHRWGRSVYVASYYPAYPAHSAHLAHASRRASRAFIDIGKLRRFLEDEKHPLIGLTSASL